MNPFEKLPYDLYLKIEKEVERRIFEFYKKNPDIEKKLSFEDKERMYDWFLGLTTHEFYRIYGITEEELNKYYEENKIVVRNDLPEFKDLK